MDDINYPETLARMSVESREYRIEAFSDPMRGFGIFALYYFIRTPLFIYNVPHFHRDFYDDGANLSSGEIDELVWIAFRESAKSTIGKILALYCICMGKKRYINFDSYDKAIAEASLFDITVWLQSHPGIIEDFGHLYIEDRKVDEEKKLKRINAFITANKVKVEAFSTGQSTRGRVYEAYRPDLFVLDDVENSETVQSAKVTQGIISHIEELRSGLPAQGAVLYLGNYLSDAGVMRYVKDAVSRNKRSVIRDVPVVSEDGIVSWRDKYVLTDEEMAYWRTKETNKPKISLESLRKKLGDQVFEKEMMNNPPAAGETIFDRRKIDELKKLCYPARVNSGGFMTWDRYNPAHRYAIGADTAEGTGGDSCASVLIDFSKTPNEQVGSFADDRIAPDTFGSELAREGNAFGTCLLGPEINNTGFATLAALKPIYPVDRMYRREEKDRASGKLTKKLGWRTTEGNKYEIIFGLKRGVEDGDLVIRDERILAEMREYTQMELRGDQGLATRHFDLLMAAAIAWAMRSQARPADKPNEKYKQPPYEPSSVFEAGGGEKPKDIFNVFE